MEHPTSLFHQIYEQQGAYATPTQMLSNNYNYMPKPTIKPTPTPIISNNNNNNNDNNNNSNDDNCCSCIEAKSSISSKTHLNAHDIKPTSLLSISKILFSSCASYKTRLYNPNIWKHARANKPDLWIWLGDNVYSDGVDMNHKRKQYNSVRDDKYYNKYGLIGEPKIPVTGIWDDHDFGANDLGSEYICPELSQREFCIHFNISNNDKRHWEYKPKKDRRKGIYSSLILPPPHPYNNINSDTVGGGVHIINLDTRSQRSILKKRNKSACDENRNNIDFINKEQWDWLENELLGIKSKIKIISTSVQALTPSDSHNVKSLCSYDGDDGTFMNAMHDLGEDDMHYWMKMDNNKKDLYVEKWADIPKARYKLLTLAQLSINRNMTKKIIFISGNAHFGDFLAKRMPDSTTYGPSQILYEVVSSGVGQTPRMEYYPNPLRVRLRSCDTNGDGYYYNECKFPFIYNNQTYYDCTTTTTATTNIIGDNILNHRDPKNPWCPYKINDVSSWGYCLKEEDELVPKSDQHISSLSNGNINNNTTCSTQNYHHICGMTNMYGGIYINWNNGTIHLSNYSPLYNQSMSSITMHFETEFLESAMSPSPPPPPPSSLSKFSLNLFSFLSSSPTASTSNATAPPG